MAYSIGKSSTSIVKLLGIGDEESEEEKAAEGGKNETCISLSTDGWTPKECETLQTQSGTSYCSCQNINPVTIIDDMNELFL